MERYYWGALSAVPGLGDSRLEELVARLGNARSAYLAGRQELLATGLYKVAAVDKFLKLRVWSCRSACAIFVSVKMCA